MMLFVRRFVFFKKKTKRKRTFFFSLFVCVCFLMQIWYGWKDLVETFPTLFFFFEIFRVTVKL